MHSLASCDLLTQGAIGHATADQLMTKGHLAMTRWPNGRERERKLSRISKVEKDPLSKWQAGHKRCQRIAATRSHLPRLWRPIVPESAGKATMEPDIP